jgi:hypothetical protein
MIRSKIMGTGEKAGKKTDANCKGSGWVKCELCRSGKVDCGKCTGGSRSVTCSGCRDAKTVKCRGCSFGRWRAFETCGRVLHAASRFDDAAAYYATALRLVTEYTIDESAEPTMKKVQQDWIGENRSRVEAEIAAAEAKLPPPAVK